MVRFDPASHSGSAWHLALNCLIFHQNVVLFLNTAMLYFTANSAYWTIAHDALFDQ
jgi:hypothetical protein